MKMERNQDIEKESRLQWFLFIIVIPSLFAITLAVVIMTVAGVNVMDAVKTYTNNIPIISQYVDVQKTQKKLGATIEKQNEMIAKQKKQIRSLENQLSAKQQEVDQLKQELEHLQQQQSQPFTEETAAEDETVTVEDIANIYSTMSEKNAAAILTTMSESDVLMILSALDSDKAAAILEKMPPDQAAKYTSMLTRRAGENQVAEGAVR
jgi:flagellar protein FlbB